MRIHAQTLPDVSLTDINGNKVNVRDLAKDSNIIILDFWATWCIPCKQELTNIAAIYDDWKKKYNVKVIAISIDDARNSARVKAFVNGQGWTYEVLLDVNQDLRRALNFENVPFTLLINKKGKIVYEHNSYVQGDEFVLENEIKKLVH
jgi:peroxiredoxin